MIRRETSCIVLGGGGFIGMNLCRRLYSSGFRVRAFGRHCAFPDELAGVEWYQGDFGDSGALTAAIETFEVVFHLIHATTPQSANLNMRSDVERNVLPSIALLDICRKLGVRRVVFVSTGGTIYGCPSEIPTSETAPTDPITAYAISKLAIEKYLGLYRHLYGLECRILRVANPYGPLQIALKNQGVVAALVARAVGREPIEIWGDGSVIRDFILIDDVVDALETVIDDPARNHIFNIGSGEGRSLRDVIAAIERILGRKLDIAWKPKRSVDVPVSVLAISRAREELGWSPKTPFEVGLQKTISWWQGKGGR